MLSPSRLLQTENEQLHEQAREFKDENSRLRKLLSEKEFEIKCLKKKREEDRLALVGKQHSRMGWPSFPSLMLKEQRLELFQTRNTHISASDIPPFSVMYNKLRRPI